MIISQIPAKDIYQSASETLATLLPPDLKAACDRILGEKPEPKEKWSIYQTTLTHYQNRGAK